MIDHATAHRRAVGQLLLAALGWSLGGVLIKAVPWTPLAVASGRGLIAAAFLMVVTRTVRLRLSADIWVPAIAYATCTLLFVTATKLTTAANAILLQYTAPVWVAILGHALLGERATRSDWITIAAALGGMSLFLAEGLETGNFVGDLVAVASGIAFATMTIAFRRQKVSSPAEAIILGNLIAGAIGLPALLAAPALDAVGTSALVGLGVAQLGVPYWLYSRAILHVTALEAVLIPILEPILNPLWVLLVMQERPRLMALVGGAIVVAAVTVRALVSIRRSRTGSMATAALPSEKAP